MLLALPLNSKADNQKIRATKSGQRGLCPACMQEVYSRCGKYRIKHWAHFPNCNCVVQWKPETPWHRQWKSEFPDEWQEVVHHDEKTGEKHVADVKLPTNLVLEFQHSSISEGELQSRNDFYKNLFWVVDARSSFENFLKEMSLPDNFVKAKIKMKTVPLVPIRGCCIINNPEKVFPKRWLNCTVPVIFDLSGKEDSCDDNVETLDKIKTLNPKISDFYTSILFIRQTLWLLLPRGNQQDPVMALAIHRNDFVETLRSKGQLFAPFAILSLSEKKVLPPIRRKFHF